MRALHGLMLCACGLTSFGCLGPRQDLDTVAELYREARYEAAQSWFVALRPEYASMTKAERTTFHYLSGMTAYRLSQPEEALHELALAAHLARDQREVLTSTQLAVLYRTLGELTAKQSSAPASP